MLVFYFNENSLLKTCTKTVINNHIRTLISPNSPIAHSNLYRNANSLKHSPIQNQHGKPQESQKFLSSDIEAISRRYRRLNFRTDDLLVQIHFEIITDESFEWPKRGAKISRTAQALSEVRIVTSTRVVNYFTRVPQLPEMPTSLATCVEPRERRMCGERKRKRIYQAEDQRYSVASKCRIPRSGFQCISDQRNQKDHDPCPSSSFSSSMAVCRLHRALVRFSTHRLRRTSWSARTRFSWRNRPTRTRVQPPNRAARRAHSSQTVNCWMNLLRRTNVKEVHLRLLRSYRGRLLDEFFEQCSFE